MMRRLLIIAIVILSGTLAADSRAVQEEKSSHDLKMFVSPRSSSVCLGEKAILFDVLAVNESTHDMMIDVGNFSARIAYMKISTPSSTNGSMSGMTSMLDRLGPVAPSPQLVNLKPKESFQTQMTASLSDEYFSEPGIYRAMPSIMLGTIERASSLDHGIIFELRRCK